MINVSEGRDMELLRTIAHASGPSLVDVHTDGDHHRSVFTLAGPGPRDAAGGARSLAAAVAERCTIVGHEGEHPRFGALDVVPFVALGGSKAERARAADEAREFAQWWAHEFAVPVFLYDDADPEHRDLPNARSTSFHSRAPDFGPGEPHDRLGATAVGARAPLVACNCVLVSRDVSIARRIAREMRERSGGLPGVRALGFLLPETQDVQVSMNLFALEQTSVQDACLHVRELARAYGTDIAEVELVGLIPERDLDRCTDDFLRWSGLDAASTVEARVGNGPRRWPGDPPPGSP